MKLILIRHAETDGNKNRYVGREDIGLNAAGRRQAANLAAALAMEAIDVVFTSPLMRAKDTARPIAAARGLEIAERRGLVEIDYGELQGTIKGERPFSLRREYLGQPMPGGESLRDVWRRLEPVAQELADALRAGNTTAVVGHYWSNRLLLALMSGLTLEASLKSSGYKPANASAYALAFDASAGASKFAGARWLHAASEPAAD